MTKVKPDKVAQWMIAHQAELDSYRDGQSHSYQQNKGKADIREVIRWSEAAYGAYEW